MIFEWFDARESKSFGTSLADYYLSSMKMDRVKLSIRQIEKSQKDVFCHLVRKVESFKEKEKLNIYKKAQLCNAFKWRLLEAGMERVRADQLTSWLVRSL